MEDFEEECDDGNVFNDDGCDSNCTQTRCGNGIITSGEQCDDDNLIDGDGCDSNCTATGCGNHVLTYGEACDDGVLNSLAGRCLKDCRMAVCGDGFTWEGVEECDRGSMNTNAGDCLMNCKAAKCGDGYVRDGVESCDDGNDNNCGSCGAGCNQLWGRAKGSITINVDAMDPMNPGARFVLTNTQGQSQEFRYQITFPIQELGVEFDLISDCSFQPTLPAVSIVLNVFQAGDLEYIVEQTVNAVNSSALNMAAIRSSLPGAIIEIRQDRIGASGNEPICKSQSGHLIVGGMSGGTGSGELCERGVHCRDDADCSSNMCLNGICE